MKQNIPFFPFALQKHNVEAMALKLKPNVLHTSPALHDYYICCCSFQGVHQPLGCPNLGSLPNAVEEGQKHKGCFLLSRS
jgi:hypothetical protein